MTLPGIATLFDESVGDALPLSPELRDTYGGDLRIGPDRPHVYANFVSTIDGIVSYGEPGRSSARFISDGSAADRFVMGLLRSCAEVILSGAGTLRVERRVTWTPWQVYPGGEPLYRELRTALGRPERVRVAIVTLSGDVDLTLPVFTSEEVEPMIVTSLAGAERLAAAGSGRVRVRAVGVDGRVPTMREIVDAVAQDAGGLILSEAGPTIFGQMLRDQVIDELFLSVAPRIAGRSRERPGVALVDGTSFAPGDSPWGRLVSLKRAEDGVLLLRYALRR